MKQTNKCLPMLRIDAGLLEDDRLWYLQAIGTKLGTAAIQIQPRKRRSPLQGGKKGQSMEE